MCAYYVSCPNECYIVCLQADKLFYHYMLKLIHVHVAEIPICALNLLFERNLHLFSKYFITVHAVMKKKIGRADGVGSKLVSSLIAGVV